jgi:hypothetical protein
MALAKRRDRVNVADWGGMWSRKTYNGPSQEQSVFFVIVLIFGGALFAVALQLLVAWMYPDNPSNTWLTAGIVGVVFALPAAIGLGFLFAILPIIGLILLLVQHYDLSLLRSLGVVAVMGGIQFVLCELVPRTFS